MRSSEPEPSRLATGITVFLVALYVALAAGVVALGWSLHNNPLDPSILAPVGLAAFVFVGR